MCLVLLVIFLRLLILRAIRRPLTEMRNKFVNNNNNNNTEARWMCELMIAMGGVVYVKYAIACVYTCMQASDIHMHI